MDESIALTSIGRDGERSDLVTEHEKARNFRLRRHNYCNSRKAAFAGGNLSDSEMMRKERHEQRYFPGNTGHNRNADAYGRGHYPSCMQ